MNSNNRRFTIFVLYSVFFLSGFTALVYQVAWQRMIGLFTGLDLISVTIVVGAYLAGLGIGNYLGGVYADRLDDRQAIRMYGISNLGIAVFAASSRLLYYDLLFKRLLFLAESPLVMFFTVFVILLVPTALMGLSLPFLSRALVRNTMGAARLISNLYAVNTLGAGFGAFVSGWILIGNLGFDGTAYMGAAISVLIGIIALVVSLRLDQGNDLAHKAQQPSIRAKLSLHGIPGRVWGWCGLVLLSGFVVISLEIVWFRLLDFVMKSTAYTFGHLLTFFLVGDALGSLYGTRILSRVKDPRRTFLQIQGIVLLYVLLSIVLILAGINREGTLLSKYTTTSDGMIALSFSPEARSFLYPQAVIYLILPTIILLIPGFLIGLYYPIVQKAIQTDTDTVGQRVGLVSAANILGNTLGSVLTGVFLLNVLGTSGTLKLLGILAVIFMTVLLVESRSEWRERKTYLNAGITIMLLATICFVPDSRTFWTQMHGPISDLDVLMVAEDATGVAAIRVGQVEAPTAAIWLNGRLQGMISPLEQFHTWLGLMPVLAHPSPKQILVIGIGTGNTPYAAGANPLTEYIEAVEIIEPDIDVLSDYSQQADHEGLQVLFDDLRYKIVIGDGRREVALSTELYDIIVLDAMVPHWSHAGTLYSQEFYQTVQARLTRGGFFVQWDPNERVEATITSVFPYAIRVPALLIMSPKDPTAFEARFLVASNEPIPFNRTRLLQMLSDSRVEEYLQKGRVDSNIFRSWIDLTPSESWTPETPRLSILLNTDLFPRDEYYLNNLPKEFRYSP